MSGLSYRRATKADFPFIIDSWVSSYKDAHAAGMIPSVIWAPVMNVAVEIVFARPDVEVWVAYVPGEETGTDLYGWLCVERKVTVPKRQKVGGRWETVRVGAPDLVHYVYVKHAYRRSGICLGLFQAAGIDIGKPFLYTCKTGAFTKLVAKHAPFARWAPLIARYPKTEVPHADQED